MQNCSKTPINGKSPGERHLVFKLAYTEVEEHDRTDRSSPGPSPLHTQPCTHMHAHAHRRSPCILNTQLITAHRCRRVHPRWCYFLFSPLLNYSERERRHRKGEASPTRQRGDPRRPRRAATRGSRKEENATQWDSCEGGAHIGDFGPVRTFGNFAEKTSVRLFTSDVCLKMHDIEREGSEKKGSLLIYAASLQK